MQAISLRDAAGRRKSTDIELRSPDSSYTSVNSSPDNGFSTVSESSTQPRNSLYRIDRLVDELEMEIAAGPGQQTRPTEVQCSGKWASETKPHVGFNEDFDEFRETLKGTRRDIEPAAKARVARNEKTDAPVVRPSRLSLLINQHEGVDLSVEQAEVC
jgi:hypothetical protein